MGHTEVSEAPAKAGSDILPAGDGIVEVGGFRDNRFGRNIHHVQCEDRSQQQGAQHQQALEEVRPAHGGETAQERIGNDNRCRQVHRDIGVNSDHLVEQCAGCLDGRRSIDRIGNQEDHRAHHLQRVGLGLEPAGQVLGNRDRVIRHDGERPQALRLKQPAQGIPDCQADGNPHLAETLGVNRGRQAHQHPGAHIGCARGKRADPGAHFPAAQEVFLLAGALAAQEEEQSDADHKYQVNDKYDRFCPVVHFHGNLLHSGLCRK